MIKFLTIMMLFLFSVSALHSQNLTGEIFLVIKAGDEITDLNGDGKNDIINLGLIDDQGDYSSFILTVNDIQVRGKHSYNVDNFLIVDLDRSDNQKEIAVHTPNPNGPDEYIIYKYDGSSIKQIGRTYSTTTFNGDGTVGVVSYMPFWDKNDTYIYDRDKDELVWVEKKEYDIEVECAVIEPMAVHQVIDSRGFDGYLDKGQKIKILKAKAKVDCNKTGPYDWGLCDEFYYVADDGREGWATMEQMMGKIDLPLIP
jgi:hypothetical protein